MSNATYRQRTEGLVTHSKIEDFAFCELLYKIRWIDGTEIAEDEEESDALVIGSAYDLYMQSREKFDDEYEVVARRTGKSAKKELTVAQMKTVRTMAAEMARQPFYNPVGEKQHNVRVKFSENVTLSGTIDEFQKENSAVIDDKTSAGVEKFAKFRDKYFRQLAFYQWLAWLSYSVLCDGLIRMVTKEKTPKAMFCLAPKDALKGEWERFALLAARLEECVSKGEWRPSPRENCLKCPAYGVCPNSPQQELYPL